VAYADVNGVDSYWSYIYFSGDITSGGATFSLDSQNRLNNGGKYATGANNFDVKMIYFDNGIYGGEAALNCEINYSTSEFVCTAAGGTTFLFMGADFDGITQNDILGISKYTDSAFASTYPVYISVHCPWAD
jgi:hypothetical protein